MRSPQARPALDRACAAIATVAGVWFAFTAWWGMAGPPLGGHLGNGAAGTVLLAENGLKWHTVYPLFDWFGTTNPYPIAAACHHPFGMFWLSDIALVLFGHHDFVVNLPAVLMSSLMPLILYKLGKHCWGPVAGMAAVLGFTILPLTTAYSIFHGLEVTTIFGSVLFYLGTARYQTYGRRRDLAFVLIGALFATAGDWAGYLALAPVLAWGFLRAFVLPSWMTPAIRALRYHRWWALSVVMMVTTLFLWVWLFQRADKINEWLSSAVNRGGGKDIPLSVVLESRKAWIAFSFTPLAIAIGKVAAFVALGRFLWKRTDHELFSLAMLLAAAVQYIIFKQGADVHIFWPHYFGAYYALALAQLAATAFEGSAFIAGKLAPAAASRIAPAVALSVVLLPSLMLTPDTVRALKVWRETGGRYDDHGALIRSHGDLIFVLRDLIAPKLQPGDRIAYQSGANVGWEHSWSLRADMAEMESPSDVYPFWIARASALGADRLKKVSATRALAIYGDVIVWTRGTPFGPVDAYSLGEHEPNLFQWMFTNNVEPVRELPHAPDPFLTWEWRVHLDEQAFAPTASPTTLNEQRIAHNVAVERGDAAGAERLREQIVAQLVRDPEAHYDGGHELMGVRVTKGVQPMLEVWFAAGGPTDGDTHFHVRSHIVRPARFSLIPANETDREMAWPPALSTKLWKKGFIYKFECVMNHRIGLERYTGFWAGGPAKHGARDPVVLVDVE